MDLQWTNSASLCIPQNHNGPYPTAGHGLESGLNARQSKLFTVNSHRKSHQNVLRVFDVCKKCKAIVKIIFDLQQNNSQEFPELFDCWAFCLLEAVTGSVITQEYRERFGRAISVSTSSENLSTTNGLLPLGIKTQRLSSAEATIS